MIAICSACKAEYDVDQAELSATDGLVACRECGGKMEFSSPPEDDLPAPTAAQDHALVDLPAPLAELPASLSPSPPPPADEMTFTAPKDANISVEEITDDDEPFEMDASSLVSLDQEPAPPPPAEAPPPPAPEAPALMEELITAPPPPAGEPAAPTPSPILEAPPPMVAVEKKPCARRTRSLIAAGVVVLLAGAAAVWLWPRAATEDRAPVAAVPAPIEPPAKAEPAPVAVVPATLELGEDNVDVLTYRELKRASTAFAKSLDTAKDPRREALLLWALYRLAAFGDTEAQSALAARVPKPAQAMALGARAAAAAFGLALLQNRAPSARAQSERLLKGRFRGDASLSLIAARSYDRPAMAPKALRHIETAVTQAASNNDLELLRAELRAQSAPSAATRAELFAVLKKQGDVAASLQVTDRLLDAGMYELADTVTAAWRLEDADALPRARRGAFLRLLTRRRWRDGDFTGALAVIAARLTQNPGDLTALLERAALQTDPKVAAKELAEAIAAATDPVTRARLLCEHVRVSLTFDIERALAAAREGEPRQSFTKYAEGLIAEKQGKIPAAKAAFTAAAGMKPAIAEPRAALIALGAQRPEVKVAKLTQLAKSTGSAAAEYRLGRALMQTNNTQRAEELFDKLLWTAPAVAPALELLLVRLEALERSGRAERALTIVTAMHEARPKDEVPLRLLLGMATRGRDPAAIVEAQRALLELAPEDEARKLALVAALNDAGEHLEAETLLKEAMKSETLRKHPQALLQLGRAWISRDAVKARALINEASSITPSAAAYVALADLEKQLTHLDEAAAAYRKATELDPALHEARYALIDTMMKRRNFDDAAAELRRLLVSSPKEARAHELLANVLLELGDSKAAVASYQSTIDAGGENGALLMKLARLQLERLGLVGPAAKTLRRAVKLDPKLAEARYYLGLALKDLGRNAEAKGEFRQYLTLAPQGEFAEDARRYIVDLEKRPQ